MTVTKQAYPVDTILSIQDSAVAVREILSGSLDDKIAETRSALAALKEQQSIAANLADAEKIRSEAERTSAARVAEAELALNAAKVEAKRILDEAQETASVADQRAKTLADLAVSLNDREANLAAFAAVNDDRTAKLDDRQANLDAREKALAAREAELAAKQADFNARLDALKAPLG